MFFFMLDLRFKNLHLVASFIGFEQNKVIVEKNDRNTLYPMLFENATIDQDVDEDCSLNIFEMIASTNEPTKEVVNRKLLILKRFQMDAKNIKFPL